MKDDRVGDGGWGGGATLDGGYGCEEDGVVRISVCIHVYIVGRM